MDDAVVIHLYAHLLQRLRIKQRMTGLQFFGVQQAPVQRIQRHESTVRRSRQVHLRSVQHLAHIARVETRAKAKCEDEAEYVVLEVAHGLSDADTKIVIFFQRLIKLQMAKLKARTQWTRSPISG